MGCFKSKSNYQSSFQFIETSKEKNKSLSSNAYKDLVYRFNDLKEKFFKCGLDKYNPASISVKASFNIPEEELLTHEFTFLQITSDENNYLKLLFDFISTLEIALYEQKLGCFKDLITFEFTFINYITFKLFISQLAYLNEKILDKYKFYTNLTNDEILLGVFFSDSKAIKILVHFKDTHRLINFHYLVSNTSNYVDKYEEHSISAYGFSIKLTGWKNTKLSPLLPNLHCKDLIIKYIVLGLVPEIADLKVKCLYLPLLGISHSVFACDIAMSLEEVVSCRREFNQLLYKNGFFNQKLPMFKLLLYENCLSIVNSAKLYPNLEKIDISFCIFGLEDDNARNKYFIFKVTFIALVDMINYLFKQIKSVNVNLYLPGFELANYIQTRSEINEIMTLKQNNFDLQLKIHEVKSSKSKVIIIKKSVRINVYLCKFSKTSMLKKLPKYIFSRIFSFID